MKKISLGLFVLPFVLTGCQEWDGMFGDSSRDSYDNRYSHSANYESKSMDSQNKSSDPSKPVVKKAAATAQGAEGASVTTPASSSSTTERKGSGVPLNAPAVPSVAPTVGQ